MAEGKWLLGLVAVGCLDFSATKECKWIEDTSVGGAKTWSSVAMSDDGQYQTAVVYNGNIWKSADFGSTWTMDTLAGARVWTHVELSSSGEIQTALAYNGHIWTSTNYGENWTQDSTVGNVKNWKALAISSDGKIQTAFVTTSQTTAVFEIWTSDNGGANWIKESWSPTRQIQAAAMTADGTKQVALIQEGSLYINSGSNWTGAHNTSGLGVSFAQYNFKDVAMSDNGTHITTVSGEGIISMSSDGGSTWNVKETNKTWSSVAMSADGAKQMITGKNYLWSTSNYGVQWTETTFSWTNSKTNGAMSADGTYKTVVPTSTPVSKIWTANCTLESNSPDNQDNLPPSDSGSLGAGAIAGIVVGSLAGVIFLPYIYFLANA